jgi:hypothetical protein
LSSYGHGEEMMFLEILDEFYDDIYRSYGDYCHILNNFIHPTTGFHYINNIIIKNYQQLGYHKECYECCKTVLHEIELHNVNMDYENYFSILFSYYISAYYYKGKEDARNLVIYIMELVRNNSHVREEYEKNIEIYRTNFLFALTSTEDGLLLESHR